MVVFIYGQIITNGVTKNDYELIKRTKTIQSKAV